MSFPVSRELYFTVRYILGEWTEELVDIRAWENRSRRTVQVNSHGQPIAEALSELIPRLHAMYAAMNTGN